jgi:hypothetical protein
MKMTMIIAAQKARAPKNPPDLFAKVNFLLMDYSRDEIKAAVIKRWADLNAVSVQELSSGYVTGRYLGNLTQQALRSLTSLNEGRNDLLSLAQVECAFEATFTEQHRREHGVVYTPPFIARYLIREGRAMSSSSGKTSFVFCDPCCGGAAFLIAAAEVLFEEEQISYEDSFRHHIWGFDRDSVTLANAQCLIELFLASKHRSVPRTALNLHECDFFITNPKQFLDFVLVPEGFDVIATNPPYVKLQNLSDEYRSRLSAKYSGLANGSFSLALLFPIAAQQFLCRTGCLAVITQNNLFTSLAGTEVRRELQLHRTIRRIINFGHNKVFENASAYTCLLFLTRRKNEAIEFDSVRDKVTQNRLLTACFSSIPYDSLHADKWRLACKKDLEALRRIETTGVPLGEMAPIRVGFATLKDRVYIVEQVRGKCLARNLQGETREIEPEITRPAIKISTMNTEADVLKNRLRVICPYTRGNGKVLLLGVDELKARFPSAYDYLVECREFLETRDKGKKSYEAWYAWGRTQGMSALGPKLLTKTFSRGPNFLSDESDSLYCNGYAVFQPKQTLFGSAISIRAMQKILNSSVMHFYAQLTSFQIEGGFECYQKNFIERFGVPQISPSDDEGLVQMGQAEANHWISKRYELDQNYLEEFLSSSSDDPERDAAPHVNPEDLERNDRETTS